MADEPLGPAPSLGWVAWMSGNDLPAKRRVARENPEIPQKMQSRWRHRGHQAGEQVERFEHERARAVSPDLLQLELESHGASSWH
jgi:hypothetical protein